MTTMRLTFAAAGLLLTTPVLAEDTTAAAQQTMHEAMQQQMGVPQAQAMMPDAATSKTNMPDHASPQATGAGHHQAAAEAGHRAQNQMRHQLQAQQQAEQHARHGGMRQADPTRADAANSAAMGAGRDSGMMGGNDTCQAADQQRTQKMHPGGMMPGGGGSGSGMMTP